MSDREEVRTLVQKKFWLNDMEAVLGIVLVLIILGTINVFSSSFIISENNYGTPYFFLRHHLMNLGFALICGFIGFRIDYHRWRNFMVQELKRECCLYEESDCRSRGRGAGYGSHPSSPQCRVQGTGP